jgi:hypothetical protein
MGNTNSDYGPGGTVTEMKPSELRFTHDSVKGDFQDGHSMDETLKQVIDGTIPISRIPPLVVMYYQGAWYVVRGNRRLYLYQKLESNGKLRYVKVLQKNFDEKLFNRQYTSKNKGLSVRLRGDKYLEDRLNRIIGDHSGNMIIYSKRSFKLTLYLIIYSAATSISNFKYFIGYTTVDHMYLRPIQSQTYKDIEVDHMYLRPIQSQTYKDIEVDHMYLRNPIQSQTYKDIEVDHMYLRNPIQSQTYKDIEADWWLFNA